MVVVVAKMMTKSYSELITLSTFEERYNYLKLNGNVGDMTFGGYRELNQNIYKNNLQSRTNDAI